MENNSGNISFIVPCYESSNALKTLLLSIPKEHEVILVNNSQEKEIKNVASNYDCKIIQNEKNIGFGSACNIGARLAKGDFLFFLNPDSSLSPNAISELLKAVERYPEASAFNPKISDASGKHDFKRRSVLLPRKEWMSRKSPEEDKEVSVLSGSAIFIKKEVFFKISGFDENIFLYHEDDDLSIRLKAEVGPLMYIHNALVTHIGGSSSSRNSTIAALKGYHMGRSRVYAQKKHKIKGSTLKNIMFASFQLLSPEILFSPRKRAKFYAFFKGVNEEIFFKDKVK